jgi:hypothetical protein
LKPSTHFEMKLQELILPCVESSNSRWKCLFVGTIDLVPKSVLTAKKQRSSLLLSCVPRRMCALYSRHTLQSQPVFNITACQKHLVRKLNLNWYFSGGFPSPWPRIHDCLLISYQGSSESECNVSSRRPEDHSQFFPPGLI